MAVFPPVDSFTNEVGVHFQHDSRTERSSGLQYNVDLHQLEPFDRIDDSYLILTGESRKSFIQGDHHTGYDYWRSVNLVLDDKPYVIHTSWYNPTDGITSSYDYESTEFISKRHGPFNYSPVKGNLVDNAWSESVTKALLSLKGKVSASTGADLGELKQTVDMLSGDAARAAAFLRAMRRGRFAEAGRHLGFGKNAQRNGRTLASYWLEYSYGWKPLAQGMYDRQTVINEMIHRISNDIEGTGTTYIGSDEEFPYNDWNVIGSWRCRVQAVLKARISNPSLYLLNDLGLTNPIAIAWELVPFSFAVDWFLPIGNTLEALTATQGLTWRGGHISINHYFRVNIKHKLGYMNPWQECTKEGFYRERGMDFRRVALTGFPYPQLYARLNPFSTPRAANALALVMQLRK
jgi:hypothetical protein